MKMWRNLAVIGWIIILILGYNIYWHVRQNRKILVETYNTWVNSMQGAEESLHSSGLGEKPRGVFLDPNVALTQAQTWTTQASLVVGQVGMVLGGRAGNVLGLMGNISSACNEELGMMIDHGKYVGKKYEYTQPNKVTIADRDYMGTLIRKAVLKGMITRATTVGQVYSQIGHLRQLNNANSTTFGITSSAFDTFMRSTGQMQ